MKKLSATIYSPAMELPVISRRLTRRARRIKINSTSVENLTNTVPPPTEDTLERLNQLGMQYPFCVYYKQKDHDPLWFWEANFMILVSIIPYRIIFLQKKWFFLLKTSSLAKFDLSLNRSDLLLYILLPFIFSASHLNERLTSLSFSCLMN